VRNSFSQTNTLWRLSALTDGVYAIVITLLVLDLHAPETPGLTEEQLLADLQEQIPNFIAYLISFFVVAYLWMSNHWILKPLEKCDYKTFWLNFAHLLFLTLIPFTASLVGRYQQDTIAVILFSASLGLAAFSLILLHRYAATKPEWRGENTIKEWTNPNWLVTYPATLFALGSILISFINVNVAIGLWLLLPVWLFLFPRKYR
jgi:uncharacterized membrane protein